MKICITSRAPFIAGAEIAGERLAVGLHEAGHNVLVISGTENSFPTRIREKGIRVEVSPLPLFSRRGCLSYFKSLKHLRNLITDFKPDIVHSNDLPSSQITTHAAKGLEAPIICHHRWIFEDGIDWFNKHEADHHIYVSRATHNALAKNSKTLQSTPATILHDGIPIPPRPTQQSKTDARLQNKVLPEKLIVLFVGQISSHKGTADIIDAWSKLAMLNPAKLSDCELIFVGEDLKSNGEYLRQMKQKAESQQVHARFAGFSEDTKSWFDCADIVLVPSHSEPLGLVTLEAMSACVAVVGTNVGGIPEVCLHDETGLLVPPNAPRELAGAINRLISSPSLRKQFGEAGRIRCEKSFSIQQHTNSIISLYQQLCDHKRDKAGHSLPR